MQARIASLREHFGHLSTHTRHHMLSIEIGYGAYLPVRLGSLTFRWDRIGITVIRNEGQGEEACLRELTRCSTYL